MNITYKTCIYTVYIYINMQNTHTGDKRTGDNGENAYCYQYYLFYFPPAFPSSDEEHRAEMHRLVTLNLKLAKKDHREKKYTIEYLYPGQFL